MEFDAEMYESEAFPTQRDMRRDQRGGYHHATPMESLEENMTQRLEAIHRRLLERATGGRLTFDGDRIVRRGGGVRERDGLAPLPEPAVAPGRKSATSEPRQRDRVGAAQRHAAAVLSARP